MNVEELLTLPSAVSWTDKPFTYYIHTIDRSLVSISVVTELPSSMVRAAYMLASCSVLKEVVSW